MSKKVLDINELKSKYVDGNATAITKQHALGKKTARERIAALFDAGSFIEIGLFANSRLENVDAPCDGVITGYGQIDGRLVFAVVDDYTVLGGSMAEIHAKKIVKCQEEAMKVGAPIIYAIDSDGVRLDEGIDALSQYGKVLYNNTLASGVIPQISIILGKCVGALTYCPALSDFVFVVDKVSKMFITGPEILSLVSEKNISADDIGSALTHSTLSGVAHIHSVNEDECMLNVRRLISFLPQNNLEKPEILECNDDLNRLCDNLNGIATDKDLDMKNVILSIVDNNDFYEIQAEYATNVITGFARLGGRVIGIVANQAVNSNGSININASDKMARFIGICDSFNIPILTLEDAASFIQSEDEEKKGLIRHFAKVLYAYSEATVPLITVIVNKAYGSAYIGMCSKYIGADYVYAWPTSKIGIMSPESAVSILYEKEIKSSSDPVKTSEEKIAEYLDTTMNPIKAASRGYIDDIIEPSNMRKILISSFDVLSTKAINKKNKKHGNMPV